MTNAELNRDIKRLATSYLRMYQAETDKKITQEEYFQWIEDVAKRELRRLCGADPEMSVMTAANIRRVIRLNLSIRAIALHNLGLSIDLDKI